MVTKSLKKFRDCLEEGGRLILGLFPIKQPQQTPFAKNREGKEREGRDTSLPLEGGIFHLFQSKRNEKEECLRGRRKKHRTHRVP